MTTCNNSRCFRDSCTADVSNLLAQCPDSEPERRARLSGLLARLIATPCATYCEHQTQHQPGEALACK